MSPDPLDMLTPAEHHEFRFIVQNARAELWIGSDDAMAVTKADTSVLVTRTAGHEVQTRRYEHDGRWLFEFLRDLAMGAWRGAGADFVHP
jgi:hypothetical protein